jgi:membrane dipeptidase
LTHDIPVLDGHNDALLRLERAGSVAGFVDGDGEGHLDLPRARAGGFAGGFFACFTPADVQATEWNDDYAEPIEADHARDVVRALRGRLAKLEEAGAVRIVRSAAEVEACLHGGPLAAIWHVEGAEAIDPGLEVLPELYADGLRSLGIVWSRPNAFAHGVPFDFPASPDTGPGLTEPGRRLVGACNRLRILLDLSHLNERGFWDVAELSDAPLVATHSAAHALTPSTRNLTDAQLDAIGDSGGVVGINLNVSDLRSDGRDDPDTPLERFVAHADHVAARIGGEHVALGSDFDGATMPDAVGDAAGIPRLLEGLGSAGWDEPAVRAFAHGNWLRVLRATWGV